MTRQAALKCILAFAMLSTFAVPARAQESLPEIPEAFQDKYESGSLDYKEGFDDGHAAAGCQILGIFGPLMGLAALAEPEVSMADFFHFAEECGLDVSSPDLSDQPPEETLPPDSERRIEDASCAELDRRYTRVESISISDKSERDILYESHLLSELRRRCF